MSDTTTTNPYQAKLEARADRLANRAARLRGAASAMFKSAMSHIAGIEPGQPILVDHYSGRRHRGALARHDRAMRKACNLEDAAKRAAERAAAVGTGGISGDDPEAIVKLHSRVDRLRDAQERMKAANAAIRKHKKAGEPAQVEALVVLGFSEGQAASLLHPRFGGRPGFPAYSLTNNNANIHRIEERIKSLEYVTRRELAPERWRVAGVECDVVADKEDNRLRLMFDGKPGEDVRTLLKRSGWRWSPSAVAWQRHLHTACPRALRRSMGAELVPTA